MKKIILGFVLGLTFTSFAYVLINPELPSMVGITDTTQIDLTKADEIISDPLVGGENGMIITAADLNAKFYSLNMKIDKLDCDNQVGVFTGQECLLYFLYKSDDGIQSYQNSTSFYSKEKMVNSGMTYEYRYTTYAFDANDFSERLEIRSTTSFPSDETSCLSLGGTWDNMMWQCSLTRDQCLEAGFFWELYGAGATLESNDNERCWNTIYIGNYQNATLSQEHRDSFNKALLLCQGNTDDESVFKTCTLQ